MPIHDKSPRPQEFAAVDLGSNSFHMVIARVVDGAMQIIVQHRQESECLTKTVMDSTTTGARRHCHG